MSPEEARGLLDPGLPRPVSDELYRLSGGNPFYLGELARAARRGGGDAFGSAAGTSAALIPAAVQGVLAEEVAVLSPQALALIQGAAVAGDPFEVGLAATVGDGPEGDELVALDELLDADLVRPSAIPRRFEFRHPLVRHAVYEAAGPGWRIGAHARAAAALAAQGASVGSRAHHVEHSARPGDVASAGLLIEAADAAAGRAPATAARWYEAALSILPETASMRPGRVEVLVALARTLESVGRLEESRAALDRGARAGAPRRPRPAGQAHGQLRWDRATSRSPRRRSPATATGARGATRSRLSGGCRAEGRAQPGRSLRGRLGGHARPRQGGDRGRRHGAGLEPSRPPPRPWSPSPRPGRIETRSWMNSRSTGLPNLSTG